MGCGRQICGELGCWRQTYVKLGCGMQTCGELDCEMQVCVELGSGLKICGELWTTQLQTEKPKAYTESVLSMAKKLNNK